MADLVSVILPTYNRAHLLSRSIESVLKQSYTNLELIIIDDGSDDNTEDLVSAYQQKDLRIIYLKTKNKGVSAARNLGIKKADGEWLAFIDSDDEWLKQKLEKQIHYLNENPKYKVIHTNEIWIRNGLRVNPHKKHEKLGGRIFKKSLQLCMMSPSTIMIHHSVFNYTKAFREDFPVCEDYELWLRLSASFEIAYLDDFCIKKYGGHEDQLSKKYKAMDYWRLLAMRPFLEDDTISLEDKAEVNKVYQQKFEVLYNGCQKHRNKTLLKKLESMKS